jgi:hypothetical protein
MKKATRSDENGHQDQGGKTPLPPFFTMGPLLIFGVPVHILQSSSGLRS